MSSSSCSERRWLCNQWSFRPAGCSYLPVRSLARSISLSCVWQVATKMTTEEKKKKTKKTVERARRANKSKTLIGTPLQASNKEQFRLEQQQQLQQQKFYCHYYFHYQIIDEPPRDRIVCDGAAGSHFTTLAATPRFISLLLLTLLLGKLCRTVLPLALALPLACCSLTTTLRAIDWRFVEIEAL